MKTPKAPRPPALLSIEKRAASKHVNTLFSVTQVLVKARAEENCSLSPHARAAARKSVHASGTCRSAQVSTGAYAGGGRRGGGRPIKYRQKRTARSEGKRKD